MTVASLFLVKMFHFCAEIYSFDSDRNASEAHRSVKAHSLVPAWRRQWPGCGLSLSFTWLILWAWQWMHCSIMLRNLQGFSGGRWTAPIVVRAPCGGGYGDGGQHEQTLWGWLAHIPGLSVVVPSTPADAGGLMITALQHAGPVIFLEHKLLSKPYLEFLGSGGRKTVQYDVPASGMVGPVPKHWDGIPLGRALLRREGKDLTMVSLGVGVHRALEAAEFLKKDGIDATVLDLRTISPLDKQALCKSVAQTRHLLVIDEDYEGFGLSGELAALVLEAGLPFKYARVCTQTTIPYARRLEDQTLPSVTRIVEAAQLLVHALRS